MERIVQDIRFALRAWRHNALVTGLALLCLILGIGANAAIYSVLHAVVLRELPYRTPEQLVRLNETFVRDGQLGVGSVSIANFSDWRAGAKSFADMAAYGTLSADLGDGSAPEHVQAVKATQSLFAVLGASPMLGRTFDARDDLSQITPVVVLSERLWRRRFAGNPGIIGSRISVSGMPRTVVGVMPASFDFPVTPVHTDLWINLDPAWIQAMSRVRSARSLQVVARLRPGVDSTRAADDLAQISARLRELYPRFQRDRAIAISSLPNNVVAKVKPALALLTASVGILLLVACANVAGLLLARAAGRHREVAIRTALGASGRRLLQQFLTESLLLALIGGAIGLGVALAATQLGSGVASAILPRGDDVRVDLNVIAFTLAVSIGTGVLFGIVPALRGARAGAIGNLSGASNRSGAGRRERQALRMLVSGEIAVSLLLLCAAGLFGSAFRTLMRTDLGLDPAAVITFHASAGRTVGDSARYVAFYGPVIDRLRALPGVRSAGFTSVLPIQGLGEDRLFTIVGQAPPANPSATPVAEYRVISPQYFASLRIGMLAGRDFGPSDDANRGHVAIINDVLARRYFEGKDPLNEQIDPGDGHTATIVGVVRSVHQFGLDQDARPEFYVPASQHARELSDVAFVVATDSPPSSLAQSFRDIVRSLAPQQPVFAVESMADIVARSLETRTLTLTLLACFAVITVLLAAAGIYGVMTHVVAQRRREIGIRMALGARPRDIASLVFKESAGIVAIGLVAGTVVMLMTATTFRGLLYGMATIRPGPIVGAVVAIAVIGSLAAALPALRAAATDPMLIARGD